MSKVDLLKKWQPLLDHEDMPTITSKHKREVTAQILENTEKEYRVAHNAGMNISLLNEAAPVNQTGSSIDNFDPVMIAMVRRAAPNLIAYDICGVQPMTGPSGLVFAMRPRYTDQSGADAFYNEANTGFATVTAGNTTVGQAANNVGTTPTGNTSTYNYAGGMSTAQAEALGTSGNAAFAEMAFSIEKVTVQAQSRALKGEWTLELAQDLKAIHGIDAETEIANMLSTEILAEINREVVRSIYVTAVAGANNTSTAGTFDLDIDANGRWSVEKYKGLMMQIEREANQIAKDTRRGKGNIVICSSDVASALSMAGLLSDTPGLNTNNLEVDDTGNVFAGVLNRRFKVYIDPYATTDFCVVGYKGANAMDAGVFYCPYVPLQMVRAVDPNAFTPKIAFKTRYGMVANPFAQGTTAGLGALTMNTNKYYRRFLISNVL